MPSSAAGGVEERTGVVIPNENGGFDTSVDAGVPKENPPVLAAGLVSDCVAGDPNESPVTALPEAAFEEPNVNPLDVTAGFSAVGGVVDEVPNVNKLLPELEGTAVVSLTGWSKEKGVDNLGGLGATV